MKSTLLTTCGFWQFNLLEVVAAAAAGIKVFDLTADSPMLLNAVGRTGCLFGAFIREPWMLIDSLGVLPFPAGSGTTLSATIGISKLSPDSF